MPRMPKWNEAPCPQCYKPVMADAATCPHCQAVYGSGMLEYRKKLNAENQKWSAGCVVLILVLLLGTCAFDGKNISKADDSGAKSPIPNVGSASNKVTRAVQKLHGDIMAAVKPCDEAGKSLADLAGDLGKGKASVYDGYSASKNVESACRSSWSKVSEIEVPSALTGAAKTKAEEALETCENAMIAKQMGGEAMKTVFNGDMRPSTMDDAKEKASSAQAGTIACVVGIFATAEQAGVESARVMK
jgi:hypothetical protein